MGATLAGEQAGGRAMAGGTGQGDDGDEGPKPDSAGVYFLSVEDFEWRPGREQDAAAIDSPASGSENGAKNAKEQPSS